MYGNQNHYQRYVRETRMGLTENGRLMEYLVERSSENILSVIFLRGV